MAPDFGANLLKSHILVKEGGDVLIDCRPKMSPRGLITWKKSNEALRENSRYFIIDFYFSTSIGPVLIPLMIPPI